MSMMVSVGIDNTDFRPVEIYNLQQLKDIKLKNHIAPAVFEGNYRSKRNFKFAEIIGFDIDGTLPVDQCIKRLKDNNLTHMIVPSRSHQGLEAPVRYHVFLPLSEKIKDAIIYERTIKNLLRIFPEADEKCKDASRCFYASGDQKFFAYELADPFPVALPFQEPKGEVIAEGGRNDKLFKMAVKLRNEGANYDEILAYLFECNNRCIPKLYYSEVEAIAKSASDYDDHSTEDDLGLITIDELYASQEKVDWMVDGLLTEGGVSIVAAKPKVGKSTIVRQLCKSILEGISFLGRRCKTGPVVYLALEEQIAMLKDQYMKLGLQKSKDFFIRTRPINTIDSLDYLEAVCWAKKPKLIVVDTMNLATKITNLNDYAEVNRMLEPYRDLARRMKTHILFVHHANKNAEASGTDTVMGSTAIRGAVDCIIVMEKTGVPNERRLISEQRGGEPFDGVKVSFNPETQSYSINRSVEKQDVF